MKSIQMKTGNFAQLKSFVNKATIFAGITTVASLYACNSKSNQTADTDSTGAKTEAIADGTGATYVNLDSPTGKSSSIVKDTSENGGYVYSDTYLPIDEDILFVEVSTGDTLYGPQGLVVNNAIIHENGTWKVDKTKIKRDGDEIKSGDDKLKLEDGEMKMKTNDSKMKIDDDEAKLKTSDSKTKVEDDETKVKPR